MSKLLLVGSGMEKQKKSTYNVSLPQPARDRLKEQAASQGRSLKNYMEFILTQQAESNTPVTGSQKPVTQTP